VIKTLRKERKMAIQPFWVTGRSASFIMTITLWIVYMYLIDRTRKGYRPYIRTLPAFEAIEEGIGRATEMNRPVMWSTGDKGTLFNELAPQVLMSFAALRYITELCCKYGTRQIVCVGGQRGGGADLLPYVQGIVDEVYKAHGREGDAIGVVRFIASEQSAYQMGLQGVIMRENVGANFIIAPFGDPMIPLSEAGTRVGAMQVGGGGRYGGSMDHFYVAFLDYWMICDEVFAFSALLQKDPIEIAGVAIGDYTKWVLIALSLLGFVLIQVGIDFIKVFLQSG
jgi:hypothetical protein